MSSRLQPKTRHRLFVSAALYAAAAGCATSPPPVAPGGELRVCPGAVANAPATDGAERIRSYTAFAYVRGQQVARAPVNACLSSGFGPRRGGAGRVHEGLDLYTRTPAPVAAAAGGVVVSAASARGYGKTILIRHENGVSTRYAHLSSYASGVRAGARVRQGEIIARTGATGNATAVHLHYEILIDGRPVNPLTVGR